MTVINVLQESPYIQAPPSQRINQIYNKKLNNDKLEEPKTPENQIFGVSVESYITNERPTPTSVPALTPDTVFGGLTQEFSTTSLKKSSNTSSVRRVPVPRSFGFTDSPVAPLKLLGVSSPSSSFGGNKNKTELCGFCDMPLGATFRSESTVLMQCGHAAHRECRDNLITVSTRYGDETPTCTICDGSISLLDSEVSVSKASESFEPEFYKTPNSTVQSPMPENTVLFSQLNSSSSKSSSSHPLSASSSKQNMLAQILSPQTQTVTKSPPLNSLSNRKSFKQSLPSAISTNSPVLMESFLLEASIPQSPAPTIDSSTSGSCCNSVRSCSSGSSPVGCSEYIEGSKGKMESPMAEYSLYHKTVENLFASYGHDLIHNGYSNHPIQAMSFISQPHVEMGSKSSQVALWIQARSEKSYFMSNNGSFSQNMSITNGRSQIYRTSAKDIQHAIVIKHKVESFEYRGKMLATAKLGLLRFTSQIAVTSPDREGLNWGNVTVYLFENTLVLTTGPENRVRAILDPHNAFSSVEIDRYNRCIIHLWSNNSQLPSLDFHTSSHATAIMWNCALSDPRAQLPVHPHNYQLYLDTFLHANQSEGHELLNEPCECAPAEIVLCLPYSSTVSSLSIQQDIRDALTRLGSNDKLGLILYSSGVVNYHVDLQKPFWKGWEGVFEELKSAKKFNKTRNSFASMSSSKRPPSKSFKTFDSILSSVTTILEDHNVHISTASVILVSEDDTKLGVIPTEFELAGVPIHTIGVTECHDALTLSAIARATHGTYVYSKQPEGLGPMLNQLIHMETQYVSQNVVIRLQPRIGVQIRNFRQTVLDGIENPKLIDPDNRVVEWRLGNLRKGDLHSLVFDVTGTILENQPLIQINIEYYDALGRTPMVSALRLKSPTANDDSSEPSVPNPSLQTMLNVECAISSTFKVFEEVLTSLLAGSNRRAFMVLSNGIEMLKRIHKAEPESQLTPVFQKIIKIVEELFDKQCDSIIEHKLVTRDFVLECLQKLWLLKNRRSLARRDRLESLFS